MSMSCFDCHDYMDGYNRGKKEGTIEELGKLKTEIEKMPEEYIFKTYSLKEICKDVNKIIDNRISELKGELK